MQVRGGKLYYGEAIGILLFDERRYPTLPGDVANASTYNFPVRLKVVKDLIDVPPPTSPGPFESYSQDVQRLVTAIEELNEDGVRAIVTACGFFSGVQDVLAQASKVPVFTSALMLIPIIAQMIGRHKKVGILTASKTLLTLRDPLIQGLKKGLQVIDLGIKVSLPLKVETRDDFEPAPATKGYRQVHRYALRGRPTCEASSVVGERNTGRAEQRVTGGPCDRAGSGSRARHAEQTRRETS